MMLIFRIILGLLRLSAIALVGGGMMVGLFPFFGVHLFGDDAGSYTVKFGAAICGGVLKDLGKARYDP